MRPLHLDHSSLARIVISLLQHELTLLRPAAVIPPVSAWSEETSLYETFALDSLERLNLAAAISEIFHLYETVSEDRLLATGRVGDWIAVVEASRRAYSARYSFRTSGSQGHPRLCTHEWLWFEQEMPEWAALLPGRRRAVSFVPPHHIYGFVNSVLLPQALGIPVVDARLTNVTLESGDLLISFPDRLGLLAASGRPLPADVWAITSTAPLPPGTAEALRDKGLARLLEMYGSSETSGLAYRFSPADPLTLLSYYAPQSDGDLLRTLPAGQRRLVELPDLVRWVDDRRFVVERRKDGAIQVAGINVYPQAVADRLAAHRLLREAYVRPTMIRGQQRLKAFVIFEDPRLDTPAHRQELDQWLRTELRTEERPASLTFGAAAPRNELGKLMDWPVPTTQELVSA